MKKKVQKNVIGITLDLDVEGKTQKLEFKPEELRNWINSLKILPDQKTVSLNFNIGEKSYSQNFNVNSDLRNIKRAVKYAELSTNIIPNNLRKYLSDITQIISNKKVSRVIGREHEIEKAWFFLSQKTRNNVFLVGFEDVGKTAIAHEIARRIAINDCPKDFYNKRVLMLKPEALLKIENDYLYKLKIKQLIKFLVSEKNNIILFVDKAIHMKTDIYLIFILYACIKQYNIPLITTSIEEDFFDLFFNDQTISKYINCIRVFEPSYNEIEPMVKPYIKKLEKQYGIKISNKMVKYIIFTSHLSSILVSANPGITINSLERSFLNAKRKGLSEVDKKCVFDCYDTTRINEYSKMPEFRKKTTAFHEAGHYILAIKTKFMKDTKISCVSNFPMEDSLGFTAYYYGYDIGEPSIHSKDYYIDLIAFSLAGRIAEKKFTNLTSTGASGDLNEANAIARSIIMEWGFSEEPCNINRSYDNIGYYLLPECKKEQIDNEVQELINLGTERAQIIIDENEELLKIIAEKLLVEEILTGEELEAICKEYEQNKN